MINDAYSFMVKYSELQCEEKVMPHFFSVDSYDLKSMSFKFGNDIFITFEMPGVAYTLQ